jgi:class 3 adenylate cyclase/tetratricopeptide (TPR) repeat protein
MTLCPACGHENQSGAKFCSECASPMVTTDVAAREERKIVTVLFADLVGFTSRSEQLDPEDVRALLSPYYARLRAELERFGGTVEKFIGDAVMALFGAPTAHEDDPERAVRAALAIRDWVLTKESELQLRIAVNTGEALIVLGAHSSQGEGMASGDVVNTTARLQTAAPVNGILVGETTYRATSHVITYRAAAPVAAKGKAETIPVWEAVEARSRYGSDVASASRTPLVGRTRELDALSDALARVRHERSMQLMTVAGVPGIGKSRLLAELFTRIDEDPSELIVWRQGRSLPYGDGVTFWALAEMVKAQAGILDSDSSEQAGSKLQSSVAEAISDPADAQWVEARLRPLVGLGGDGGAGMDRRDEAFTAWRRFLEALAERNPLVLVFEDLHWADDNLLDFIEYFVDWVGGVPILVVCTTRPELFERRPGWGGGKRNVTTFSLSPLSDEETASLINNLLERPVMTAEKQQALLAHAGGNPLYAEQFVRMLAERGDAEHLLLPETVQGIIAARLDALPDEGKTLLHNAAVMGKVFWLGSVTQIGQVDRQAAEMQLHALERKDFVRRARRSSVANEAEYAFLHVLVRDVAYGQIPRSRRAAKHRLAAEWIASLGRSEDHAEMLAHHYMSAIELCRSAGEPPDAALTASALESLGEAGDRAFSLNAYASAIRYYESGPELAEAGSLDRGHLLFKLARTGYLAGDVGLERMTAACRELLACGDRETAAEAHAVLSELHWFRGDRDRSLHALTEARRLVSDLKPSRAKAYVTSSAASSLMLAGEPAEAIKLGREALAMAEQLGLGELRAHALNIIGFSRTISGDALGVEDLEQSVVIAKEAKVPFEICRSTNNLAGWYWGRGDLGRALSLWSEVDEAVARFGQVAYGRWLRGGMPLASYELGRWEKALTDADAIIAEVEGGSPHYFAAWCYMTRALIRLGRSDAAGALSDVEPAVTLARLAKDPQIIGVVFPSAAYVTRECGYQERAASLVDELLAALRSGIPIGQVVDNMHTLAWTASALGRAQDVTDLLAGVDSPWAMTARCFATGDLRQAADISGEMGAVTAEARDRLWLAEALIKVSRRSEGDIELKRALTFYRSVGATRYIREGEALLSASR